MIEEKYGEKISSGGRLLPWCVRHAANLLTKYQVHTDGKTSHERLKGGAYRGENRDNARFSDAVDAGMRRHEQAGEPRNIGQGRDEARLPRDRLAGLSPRVPKVDARVDAEPDNGRHDDQVKEID